MRTELKLIYADEGKTFIRKKDGFNMGSCMCLGTDFDTNSPDTIDNYEEVIIEDIVTQKESSFIDTINITKKEIPAIEENSNEPIIEEATPQEPVYKTVEEQLAELRTKINRIKK